MLNSFEHLELKVEDAVATLRFNRPESLNAFSRAFGVELLRAVEECANDDEVRVLVITGNGRAFSAGADVKDERPRTPEGAPDLSAGLTHLYNPTILALRQMGKPVIAAVNGAAAGFSCSLACACDFILAAESAYFMLAFIRIGLVADGGATLTIPARVGLARAIELSMLGDKLPAPEALRWGLINSVHPDDELAQAADALARRLAAGPVGAYAELKALFNRQLLPALEAQLGAEAAAQFRRGKSAEYLVGTTAFRDKREPDFTSVVRAGDARRAI